MKGNWCNQLRHASQRKRRLYCPKWSFNVFKDPKRFVYCISFFLSHIWDKSLLLSGFPTLKLSFQTCDSACKYYRINHSGLLFIHSNSSHYFLVIVWYTSTCNSFLSTEVRIASTNVDLFSVIYALELSNQMMIMFHKKLVSK